MAPDNLNTRDFILQKVAPIFNKKGYAGTSLSDLTEATGLTKGAIYFHFVNKEELAVQAFKLNVKKVTSSLSVQLAQYDNSIDKLQVLTNYYRNYYDVISMNGGCPILNMGADSNNINPALFEAVKKVSKRLEMDLIGIIQTGINNGEIRSNIDADMYGKNIYAMIEGSVFMAITRHDGSYLNNMMDMIDQLIQEKFIR
ncbi:TetR/AcrR family transcriptional regulator [Mucilaginibacter sp. X4EP1]|uniref:TetR/AcrR family transcriptional regulator n=1 Tax=Mucilaginibacter sp. X4EP1 TaxID=2723092 RepID=UPI0021670DCB|nr:TetR/AcrR family transcriptional regulator [Mucilaginibacter sp. X4EP1]MCS3816112.1 AcrR family transcriptional regulator [Mucilaginibacter sp. X4EP1]